MLCCKQGFSYIHLRVCRAKKHTTRKMEVLYKSIIFQGLQFVLFIFNWKNNIVLTHLDGQSIFQYRRTKRADGKIFNSLVININATRPYSNCLTQDRRTMLIWFDNLANQKAHKSDWLARNRVNGHRTSGEFHRYNIWKSCEVWAVGTENRLEIPDTFDSQPNFLYILTWRGIGGW